MVGLAVVLVGLVVWRWRRTTPLKREKTDHRRELDRLRAEARLKYLDRLLKKHGHRCHWCQKPLKRVQVVPECRRVRVGDVSLVWLTAGGVEREDLIASVDHVRPLSKGGTNSVKNLVPSCIPCNRKRADLG